MSPAIKGVLSSVRQLVARLRWLIVAPVLQPILDEMKEYAVNLREGALMKNVPREWAIACIEKADTHDAYHIQRERAFARISFDDRHRLVRHY